MGVQEMLLYGKSLGMPLGSDLRNRKVKLNKFLH